MARGRLDLALALLDRGAAIDAVNQVCIMCLCMYYGIGFEIISCTVETN